MKSPKLTRRRGPTDPGLLGRKSSFHTEVGSAIERDDVAGYYINFDFKATVPGWPRKGIRPEEKQFHVATAQWGLGSFERYLRGEGDEWLAGAIGAGDQLLAEQHAGGLHDGAWLHEVEMPHTYQLRPPWVSAMAQGEGASLLVRLHRETRDESYAEGARRALAAARVPSDRGGASALLDGEPFPEEYPTDPPSFVLNGGIFALWGFRDVALGLRDPDAAADWELGAATLARNIDRWDTGYWSRYDLFPQPIPNVASPAYHSLHITQLRAMAAISDHPEVERAADRWQGYEGDRRDAARAFATKSAFRLAVPRTRSLAHRLPWSHARRGRRDRGRPAKALVLGYHAVSESWPSPLAVSTHQLRAQLSALAKRGYRGATFGEVARGEVSGRVVAITFDDGYRSTLENAFPVLAEFGYPGTIFVPTGWVGSSEPMRWPGIDQWSDGPHRDELLCLDWDGLRQLQSAGWEVGSHTISHPHLPQLDDRSLARELADSRRECERELGSCETLAYPYGECDSRVEAATRDAGYTAAAILAAGPVGAFHWPRFGVYPSDGRLRFAVKASPITTATGFSRVGATLERIRR